MDRTIVSRSDPESAIKMIDNLIHTWLFQAMFPYQNPPDNEL